MRTEPLFRSLETASNETVTLIFDGKSLEVPAGISVAAALLLGGVDHTRRNAASGDPRAPYCMMGVCFECLMEIDGQPSTQACLVAVRDGMQVNSQDGAALLNAGSQEISA